jgi:glutathione S-transferase
MGAPDRLHYVRIPDGRGGRAEQVRMAYALAGKPYVDVLCAFVEAPDVVIGKNPFRQFPFIVTADGAVVYQTLAIMHHVGRGTPVWPDDPTALTHALEVGVAGYDLYQWFGSFAAEDTAAKQKFELRRAPQFFRGLSEIYGQRAFAAGDDASFADCLVHEAIAWCVRRNDVCRELYRGSAALTAFMSRFESLPPIAELMARQAAARQADGSV